MDDLSHIIFSGIGGVILGIFLTEIIRRLNRVEQFNNQIFNRRLEEYIALYDLLLEQNKKVIYIFDNFDSLDPKEKEAIISSIFSLVNEFNDADALFISGELALQTTFLYIKIDYNKAGNVRRKRLRFNMEFRKIVEMIKAESGIKKVNKNFQKFFR